MKNRMRLIMVFGLIGLISSCGGSTEGVNDMNQHIEGEYDPNCPQYMPPAPWFCEDGEIIDGGVDENGCQLPPQCKHNEPNCPQYMPPAPGWCEDGEIIDGGVDENGCTLPPKCKHENIGGLFGEIVSIQLRINRADGFIEPPRDDLYLIDVTTGKVQLNDGDETIATLEQIESLVSVVRLAKYRKNESCLILAIDGAPYPPELTVSDQSVTHTFGVSKKKCAESDHSHVGDVIGCDDFQAILEILKEIFPETAPVECAWYW